MNTASIRRRSTTIPPARERLSRWPIKHALAAARERTKSIRDAGGATKQVQLMLESLMTESGWEESEFIDELCKDVIARKQ
jgi:hypothetical protein